MRKRYTFVESAFVIDDDRCPWTFLETTRVEVKGPHMGKASRRKQSIPIESLPRFRQWIIFHPTQAWYLHAVGVPLYLLRGISEGLVGGFVRWRRDLDAIAKVETLEPKVIIK